MTVCRPARVDLSRRAARTVEYTDERPPTVPDDVGRRDGVAVGRLSATRRQLPPPPVNPFTAGLACPRAMRAVVPVVVIRRRRREPGDPPVKLGGGRTP